MLTRGPVFLYQKKHYLDGEKVRYLIRQTKLRQKQVARLLRISAPQLSQYLSKKYCINALTLTCLAQILTVEDPFELVDRSLYPVTDEERCAIRNLLSKGVDCE